MDATAGKRTVLGSVLWGVATAVPVAVSVFLIYDKQRSMAGAGPSSSLEATAAVAADETGRRVAVAPLYADPELLKRKTQQDALLRPRYESARRQAEARAAMTTQGARALAPTGNSRLPAVSPAPEPPENPFPPAMTAPPPPSPGAPSPGPRFYGLPEDGSHATPPAAAPPGRRR